MSDEYRITIRLSPALYAQLEARGSHGQPLRGWRSKTTSPGSQIPPYPRQIWPRPWPMAARLDELQVQVQRLTPRVEALVASPAPSSRSGARFIGQQ